MLSSIFGLVMVVFGAAVAVGYLLVFVGSGVARRADLLRRVVEDLDSDLNSLINRIDEAISEMESDETCNRLVTSGKGSISLGEYSRDRNEFAVIDPETGELIGIVDADAFVVTEVLDPETQDVYIADDDSFSKILIAQGRKRGAIDALGQFKDQISRLQHEWHWVRAEKRYSHHLSVF